MCRDQLKIANLLFTTGFTRGGATLAPFDLAKVEKPRG
jgi:hypothetical protein